MASLGQDRVRLGFNPGGNDVVVEIKRLSADLIDLCHDLQEEAISEKDGETARVAALAMTAYEEAAMWAVKAATASK